MTDAVVSQVVVETASVDTPAAKVSQVVVEVGNIPGPAAFVSQQAIEVGSIPGPAAYVSQHVIEVLSSTADASFDPLVAFFGFLPNWADGILERWQWLTDVQTAIAGDQVRVSLIPEPRLVVEFSVIEQGWSPLLDSLVNGWQGKAFYLPFHRDVVPLAADVAAGATLISTPTAGYTWEAGGLAAFWTDPDTYEVAEILYVDPGQLTLSTPLSDAWPAGARVAPLRKAWLNDAASATRFTGTVTEARLVFELETPLPVIPDEWANGLGGPWTRDGFALFEHRPNWGENPQVEYQRRMRYFDNKTGVKWKEDPSARGWIKRTHLHTFYDRVTINRMLAWVAQRRGRAVAYLAPVWESDLVVTQPTLAADITLTVATRGYAQLYSAIAGRNYVALRHAGGWIIRKVLSAVSLSATEDQLNLDAAIGVALAPSAWLDVRWAERCHLAADTLELKWFTHDVAEATITHEQVKA